MNNLDILEKLIAFPTVSNASNAPFVAWVADLLKKAGGRVEIIEGEDGKQALWATKGPDQSGGLALLGHSDVVPAKGQLWQTDPFVLARRGETLFGRGTCDMKGFLACSIALFVNIDAATLSAPLSLGITYDEETTLAGAQRLAAWMKEKSIRVENLWLGEPSEMEVITAHKGVVSLETRFSGVAAHSSLPDKGLNAISLAMRLGDWIGKKTEEKRAAPYENGAFDPAYTTFNIGTINGGTANNIIADSCELAWEFRTASAEEQKDLLQQSEAFLAALCAENPKARVRTEIKAFLPPFEAKQDNALATWLCARTGDGTRKAVSYGTEAGYFAPFADSLVICGPGSITKAHQPDESVPLSELEKCGSLLGACAQGGF